MCSDLKSDHGKWVKKLDKQTDKQTNKQIFVNFNIDLYKQALRKLQNNAATKRYTANKNEKADKLKIEYMELRKKTLKSQVACLEAEVDLLRKLMIEGKLLNQ